MMSARSLSWCSVSHSRNPVSRPMFGVGLPSYSPPERDRVGPVAGLRAIGPPLAVDLVQDGVLADQARHHAGPAALRVGVADLFERDGLVPTGVGQPVVVLPPLAELVVPTGVLFLEPLEVLVRHGIDAPVVDRPAGGEELRNPVHVVLVDDALP